MSEPVDAFLEHHGIKGMHWGVRKERSTSSESGESDNAASDHQKLKTAAVILGSAAGVALIAGGTYYLAKNGHLPISSLSSASKAIGKKTVEDVLKPSEEELTKIIHATGNKYLPDRSRTLGGLFNPIRELERAGLSNRFGGADLSPGEFRRYGSNLEKVAVSFRDSEGRADFSGRPIIHNIILPKQHTQDITNFEEARRKAWSLVKDDYEKFWQYGLSRTANNKEARLLGLMD